MYIALYKSKRKGHKLNEKWAKGYDQAIQKRSLCKYSKRCSKSPAIRELKITGVIIY